MFGSAATFRPISQSIEERRKLAPLGSGSIESPLSTLGIASGSEDCEALIGVRDPGLKKDGVVRLTAELGHRTGEAVPVQQLVVAVVFGLLDRCVAPRLPVALAQ